MNGMEPSDSEPVLDGVTVEAERDELPPRHDSVLTRRERRDLGVWPARGMLS
jgi:hypothetical protein